MAIRDLRDWIALLEREGELVRVSTEVDPHLEVTEIVDRTVKAGGPALLFERPKGSEHPLLINQFGTERRMGLAFGVERLDLGVLAEEGHARCEAYGKRARYLRSWRRCPAHFESSPSRITARKTRPVSSMIVITSRPCEAWSAGLDEKAISVAIMVRL